jgi:hypothetical protein
MKSYDAYVKSGAMERTVGKAVLDAAAVAKAHGLPVAGRPVVPAYIAAALRQPPVRGIQAVSRSL